MSGTSNTECSKIAFFFKKKKKEEKKSQGTNLVINLSSSVESWTHFQSLSCCSPHSVKSKFHPHSPSLHKYLWCHQPQAPTDRFLHYRGKKYDSLLQFQLLEHDVPKLITRNYLHYLHLTSKGWSLSISTCSHQNMSNCNIPRQSLTSQFLY